MDVRRDDRINRILEMLDRRLHEPWSVSALAAVAGLSPSRFAHVFRATVGVSPARYLQQLRIERATQLLTRTSLPVSQIIHLVGSPDPSHFVRAFRSHTGVGMNEFRRARGQV